MTTLERVAAWHDRWGKALDFLRGRRQSYMLTFGNDHGKRVLADLAKFCRANEPTFTPDARMHALLEGRREVWLRIQNHLNLPPDKLLEIYNQGASRPQQDE